MWMNEWDIQDAVRDYGSRDDCLGEATRALDALHAAANRNSDGWHIWPKPARAADKLMRLICPPGHNRYRGEVHPGVTAAELAAALRPVKAFRTRCDWKFDLTDAERKATADRRAEARAESSRRMVAELAREMVPVLDTELGERLPAGTLRRADLQEIAVALAKVVAREHL